jgi:hypothetical protein
MTCRRAALAAATTAAIGTGVAVAQPAPPAPPGPEATQPRGPGGPPPWARGGHGGPHSQRGDMMRGPMGPRGPLTGLVMQREDKAITAPEALKIAEGFLLWMGERDWKVANAVEKPEAIEFELQTKDGGRIATFAMDRKTGRVQRVS